MKKKLVIISTFVIMMLCLTSCGSPSSTVESYLQAIKDQDMETAAELYEGDIDTNPIVDAFEDSSDDSEDVDEDADDETAEDEDSKMGKVFEEELMPKLLDFDYEIVSEEKDGDKATVEVKFTTYPLGSTYSSFYSEYITQAFTLIFSDVSDEQFDKMGATLLSTKLSECTEKTFEKNAKVELVKKDGNWIIAEYDEDSGFIDAMSGALISTADSLSDTYGE